MDVREGWRACPSPRALERQLTALGLDKRCGDRQPVTDRAVGACAGRVHAAEAIEDARQMLRRDIGLGVGQLSRDIRPLVANNRLHTVAGRDGHGGVAKQDTQNLLDPVCRATSTGARSSSPRQLELDAPLQGQRLNGAPERGDEHPEHRWAQRRAPPHREQGGSTSAGRPPDAPGARSPGRYHGTVRRWLPAADHGAGSADRLLSATRLAVRAAHERRPLPTPADDATPARLE